jgi:hypothetical protein
LNSLLRCSQLLESPILGKGGYVDGKEVYKPNKFPEQQQRRILNAIHSIIALGNYESIEYEKPFRSCWNENEELLCALRIPSARGTLEVRILSRGCIDIFTAPYNDVKFRIFYCYCGLFFKPLGYKARLFREIRAHIRQRAALLRDEEAFILQEALESPPSIDALLNPQLAES